jgi:hypothetical protein
MNFPPLKNFSGQYLSLKNKNHCFQVSFLNSPEGEKWLFYAHLCEDEVSLRFGPELIACLLDI